MNSPFFGQFSAVNGLGHGGDAGVPAWVPMGAFGFIDFQNGLYWDGTAVVSITDVIATDPDSATFFPDQVVSGQGYVSDSDLDPGGKIIGSLAPAILSGSSVFFEYDLTIGDPSGGGSLTFVGGDDFQTILSAAMSDIVTFHDLIGGTFGLGDETALSTGVHKVAIRLTDGNYALVVDGGTVLTSAATIASPAPTVLTLDLGTTGLTLRKIVSYDPTDDAALQALTA